jgi:hypothetical protein
VFWYWTGDRKRGRCRKGEREKKCKTCVSVWGWGWLPFLFYWIPISCCTSSSYSSWGPYRTSIDKKSSRIELHLKKAPIAFISMHTNKLSLSNRGEARCCSICFF